MQRKLKKFTIFTNRNRTIHEKFKHLCKAKRNDELNKSKGKKKYLINTTIYIQCKPFSTLYTTKKRQTIHFSTIFINT